MSGSMNQGDHDVLTRALRQRSDDMTGSHVDLDDVKSRARGIQRRRRTVTGVAAAVVLAIGLPVALSVTDVTRSSQPQPTNPSPSVVESAAPEPAPKGPIPAEGASAPRGDDPAISYLTGSAVHTPDGGQADLGRGYDQVTPYAGGWAALDLAKGTTSFVGPDGTVDLRFRGASLAVSADGSTMATVLTAVAGNQDIGLRPSAGEGPDGYLSSVVAFDGTAELAGFLGPEEAAYTLTTPDGETGAYVTDWTTEPRRLAGLMDVKAANEATGVVSGMTSYDELEPGSCSAVVDASSGNHLWETCDFTLEAFSPDGRYVIGTDSYHDGIGGSTVAILDATGGTVLAVFTTRDLGFTGASIWETDSTALFTTYQDGSWYLLRVAPDGSVEQALDPVRTGEMGYPWTFAVRP